MNMLFSVNVSIAVCVCDTLLHKIYTRFVMYKMQ